MEFRSSIFAALITGALALAHANGGIVLKIKAVGHTQTENSVTEVMALEESPQSLQNAKPATAENPAVTTKPIVIDAPILRLPQTNNLVE